MSADVETALAPLLDAYAAAVRRQALRDYAIVHAWTGGMDDIEEARALVRALVAAWDHDRGAHALRCGGALVEAVGRCREAMEEWR